MSLSNSVTILLRADVDRGALVIQDEGQSTVDSLPSTGPGPSTTEIVWQIVNAPGCNFPINPMDAVEFEIEDGGSGEVDPEAHFPIGGRYVVTDGYGNRQILGAYMQELPEGTGEVIFKYRLRAQGPEGEPLTGPVDDNEDEQGRVRSTGRT